MVATGPLAEIAALVGDPARAAMLQALMADRALTATELAGVAGIAPQTASGHLGRLAAARLVAVTQQGRHRYHRIATPQVARMLESMMLVAVDARPERPLRLVTGPRDAAMRVARTCYDHMAGKLAIDIADAMIARGQIEFGEDGGVITGAGERFFAELGLDIAAAPGRRARAACRPCLDWSERRFHLGGRIGAALCRHCQNAGWVRRRAESRALDVTPKGWRAFRDLFGVDRAPADATGRIDASA
jgi:DNA-binding transcriptional ArsR family regulator